MNQSSAFVGIERLRQIIRRTALKVKDGVNNHCVLGERVPAFYMTLSEALKTECHKRRQNRKCDPPILDHGMMLEKIKELQSHGFVPQRYKKILSQRYKIFGKAEAELLNERDVADATQFLHDTGNSH